MRYVFVRTHLGVAIFSPRNFDSPQSLDAWRGDCGLRRWSGRPHAAQADGRATAWVE